MNRVAFRRDFRWWLQFGVAAFVVCTIVAGQCLHLVELEEAGELILVIWYGGWFILRAVRREVRELRLSPARKRWRRAAKWRLLLEAEAMNWYRRAADLGLGPAKICIGRFFEQGLGVPVNLATARQWYEEAGNIPEAIAALVELDGNSSSPAHPAE